MTASLDDEIRDGSRHLQFISKMPTPRRLFIKRKFCASWNAAEQITCACSEPSASAARINGNDAPGFFFRCPFDGNRFSKAGGPGRPA
ncbi:hypothetical protein [Bradyrhizobium sp. CCBAU 11361]|uniref:hypothetical protein n=1 Tax=Bradyrhizobium sp. CCBAU 11361 TaxID=1630812 RepID=UPI003FA4567A